MGDALPQELPFIAQLRENLDDLGLCEETLSDMNLIRWLRARNMNTMEAEKMLRKHLQWYEDQRMDLVLSYESPKMIEETCVIRTTGFDKEGRPIFVIDTKEWEKIAQMLKHHSKDEVIRHHLKMFEVEGYMMRRNSQINNLNHLTQYILICNVEGLSWKLLTSYECTSLFVYLIRTVEQNYPETMKNIYIINAPRIFSFGWAILRPLLSDKSTAKFKIFGYNREEWSKEILSHISEDQLSEQYGGILPNDTDITCSVEDVVPRKKGSY